MTDPAIEDVLRRWRPADPPAGLRRRVVAGARLVRVWPAMAAAAALLAIVAGAERQSRALANALPAGPAPLTRDEAATTLARDAGDAVDAEPLVDDAVAVARRVFDAGRVDADGEEAAR